MEWISIINNFGKIFIMNIFVFIIYIKITNYKENNFRKTFIMILSSVLISMIYIILNKYIHQLFILPIMYLLLGFMLTNLLKQKVHYCMLVAIVAFIITYIIYLVSVIVSGIFIHIFVGNIDYKNPISLIVIPNIMYIIFYSIFTRKRLKNGFNFLHNTEVVEKIGKFVNVLWIIVIFVSGLLQDSKNITLNEYLIGTGMIIGIILIFWIKSQITKSYKSKMRDRTIEMQKTEIDEKTKTIEKIKAENLKLATAVHKYNHKFESLELAMKNALNLKSKTEFAKELSVILKETEETSTNFAKETEVNTNKLPETNIPGIDNMFKYMQEEAKKNEINFDLKINESINTLIDNIIPKEKFEILIGDHLKDAIIAVNVSTNSYKSILVTLGLVEGIYELSIYDTGIEFEIETLLKLGEEQVTTHKETGGSGIGFMTTFETLKECKASLVIEEYNPETTNYTKSVTIKFDGKNEYKIFSYRAEKIKEQKHKRRIIEKLKYDTF